MCVHAHLNSLVPANGCVPGSSSSGSFFPVTGLHLPQSCPISGCSIQSQDNSLIGPDSGPQQRYKEVQRFYSRGKNLPAERVLVAFAIDVSTGSPGLVRKACSTSLVLRCVRCPQIYALHSKAWKGTKKVQTDVQMAPCSLSPHSWHRHYAKCFGAILMSWVTLGMSNSLSPSF